MTVKRRGKLEVIADILKAIQNEEGKIKPTHLLYKSNLSHAKLKEYSDTLLKKGMIDERMVNGKKMVFIKDHGRKFLSEFERIKEFSDSFGL